MVSVEYSEAAVEVLSLLDELVEEDYKKIPDDIIYFLESCKSETYVPDIDFSAPIEELVLKEKTKEILARIYLDYLCPESEKDAFISKIRENNQKKQEELREKYNPDDLFKNKKTEISNNISNNENNVSNELPVTKKQNIFVRFFNKIKNLFK